MKLNYIINFAVIILILNGISCKDKPTEPPIEEFPPGYQHDIAWPSLADSPWPINHADPQNTGRSKYFGPTHGLVDWEFVNNSKQILSSVSIGIDSVIYAPYENGGFLAINFNGTLKWKILENIFHSSITPIITNDGSIIHFNTSGIYSINTNGIINWHYTINSQPSAVNIDKLGNIYLITNNKLIIINKSGVFEREFQFTGFSSITNLSFSPDGNTLYVSGNTNSNGLVAFDVVNMNLKWKFGKGRINWSVVDTYGNIYVNTIIDSINTNIQTLISLNENGDIRQYIKLNRNINFNKPTIDKNGNIYFVTDSLYSYNFNGNLRWSYFIDNSPSYTVSLVCDKNNDIYVINEKHQKYDVIKFNNDGKKLFSIYDINNYPGQSPAISFNRLIIPSGKDENIFSIK